LLAVWSIIPHPAMPPKRLAATLTMPSPLHSVFLELGVSVNASTTLAVIIDSSSSTIAMANAGNSSSSTIAMAKGTEGKAKTGNESGSRPRSATVFNGRCIH